MFEPDFKRQTRADRRVDKNPFAILALDADHTQLSIENQPMDTLEHMRNETVVSA